MLRSLSSTLWKNGRKLRLASFKSHPREPLDQKYATLDDDSPADGAGCLSAVEVEASAGDDGDFLLLQLTHMPREVIYRILSYLLPMELLSVGQTCKLLYQVCQDEHLWRDLYHYSKEKHHLEQNPYKAKKLKKWGSSGITWRDRYKLTFVMKQKKRKRDKNVIRKVLGSSDCEVFLSLDQTSFDCQEPNEPEQYISGEITINVRSEKMVSHGLYLLLYGEEAFRAYDGARNSIRKLKSPILASHFNILGGKSWDERKQSIVILHRGTYRYPFHQAFPKKRTLGNRLPPSFLRMLPRTGNYFRVEYHACAIFCQPFPHTKVSSMKHSLLLHNSERMRAKLKGRISQVASSPATETVEKHFMLHSDCRAIFEARLEKTYFHLDQEAITITCSINNRHSKSKIYAVSVTIIEVLGQSRVCREVIKRGAGGVGQWQIVDGQGLPAPRLHHLHQTQGGTLQDDRVQEEEDGTRQGGEGGDGSEESSEGLDEIHGSNSGSSSGVGDNTPAPRSGNGSVSWQSGNARTAHPILISRRPRAGGQFGNGQQSRSSRMLGEKRLYHISVDSGEMLRGIELTYPLRGDDIMGESLFNTHAFHQTYLLVVTFHMSFGHIDPRLRIPIFLIKSDST